MAILEVERAYTDIVRQDSSVELRNKFRSFWGVGEQLWDADYNNNLTLLNWWNHASVHNYIEPHVPWPVVPEGRRWVEVGGSLDNHLAFGGAWETNHLPPFAGAKCYVQADRLVIGYSGSEWRPFFYLWPYRPCIEISMFASYPWPNEKCASHVATSRFQLIRSDEANGCRYSRIRCNRETVNPVSIRKNGVAVGVAHYDTQGGYPRSTITLFDETVTFEVGDELSLVTPPVLYGLIWISVSLFGKVLY